MVLGLVILTLIVISCVSSQRRRSPYAAWWRVALCLFLAGNAAFLLNGTDFQPWANPSGKALVVAGTFCIWAGARTLRDQRVQPWMLAAASIPGFVASVVDDPGNSVWSGGLVYLGLTTLGLTLAGLELWFAKPVRSRITKIPVDHCRADSLVLPVPGHQLCPGRAHQPGVPNILRVCAGRPDAPDSAGGSVLHHEYAQQQAVDQTPPGTCRS